MIFNSLYSFLIRIRIDLTIYKDVSVKGIDNENQLMIFKARLPLTVKTFSGKRNIHN